jgi:tetratricopeptide (TPR) repeat protein
LKNLKKTIIGLLISIFVITTCGGVIFYSKKKIYSHQKENFFLLDRMPGFIPKYDDIRYVLLGYDNFIADLYWLRTIQFAGSNARSMNFESLYEYLDLITSLDNAFKAPYIHGALLLPLAGDYKNTIKILEKGMKAHPDYWEIPWNMAFIKYYYLEDYEGAIELYEKCSKIPNCLKGATSIANNLKQKTGRYEIALQEWQRIYEDDSSPESQKDLSKDKIIELTKLIELNKMLKLYKDKYNQSPESIDDLKNEFSKVPEEIFENTYEHNPFVYDSKKDTVKTLLW